MRKRLAVVACGLLAGVLFLGVPRAWASEKKEPAAAGKGTVEKLKVTGKLTTDDPRDKVQQNSYSQSHTYKMEAGQIYRIDVVSKDFDTLLRLEDPKGKMVAYDDDSGDDNNARLLYQPKASGVYTLVVTSYRPNETGKYTLTVGAGTPEELTAWRVKNVFQLPAEERKEVLAQLRKGMEAKGNKASLKDVEQAYAAASSLETDAPAEAAEAYKLFGKALSASDNPEVKQLAKQFTGAARRVNLVGHEMDVKGQTLAGKALDWKAYRGKVVLVDFWATWCGPCVGEVPNIKAMYEKYHDAGFDVVGISLDHDRAAVTKFMEQRKLPWTCVYDKDAGEGASMADYYGVFAIPQAILVGRDGRVISLHARGEELEQLLGKQLGGSKKSD